MESGPLEGPSEAHGGVLLDGVGVGLFAFGAFPRFHRSVGSRIHALSPGHTSEEGVLARVEEGAPTTATPQPITVGQTLMVTLGPSSCGITMSRCPLC